VQQIADNADQCNDDGEMALLPPRNGHPIWAPGFPGSGTELLRQVIDEITGLQGNDVYTLDSCLNNNTAVCKTHYPFFKEFQLPSEVNENRPATSKFHDKAFLVLRNPLKAIPSLCNYEYEYRQNATETHISKAPLEEWRAWRDRNFAQRWDQWIELIRHWHQHNINNNIYNITVYLPFEQMTAPETGPGLLRDMARELRSAGFTVRDKLECRWRKVVQVQATKKRRDTNNEGGYYVPAFTAEQQTIMLLGLGELIGEYELMAPALVAILKNYREVMIENFPLDTGDGLVPSFIGVSNNDIS